MSCKRKAALTKKMDVNTCNIDLLSIREESDPVDIYAEAQRLSDLINDLPGSPCGTLKAHMIRRNMTVEKLSMESGVSEATIKRLRNDINYTPIKTKALAICLGLKLEPPLQKDWLRKLGIVLSSTPQDLMYELLMSKYYKAPISIINDMLWGCGCQPL